MYATGEDAQECQDTGFCGPAPSSDTDFFSILSKESGRRGAHGRYITFRCVTAPSATDNLVTITNFPSGVVS